jgi:hypothetical protein
MKMVNVKYMVTHNGIDEDLEGNVSFCESLEEAKEIGVHLAGYDSDPFITIWENTAPGEWTSVMEGRIPEPEFTWFKPEL